MAQQTFNSTVGNHPEISGSFTYDAATNTLGSTYTLSGGTGISIASPNCNGNSVSFSLAYNSKNYNFHGAYNPPAGPNNARISGNCVSTPTPAGDDDAWAANGI